MKRQFLMTIQVVLIAAFATVFAACRTPNDEPVPDFNEDKTKTTLDNGGFEDGFNNWLVLEGDAFSPFSIVLSTDRFWQVRHFMAKGNRFYNGFELGEERTGAVRSQMFTLAGDGFISFLIGGGAQADKCYVSIHMENGAEVKRVANTAFNDPEMALNLHREYLDLSAYKGQVLYIRLNDYADGGPFGSLTADDFIVSMTLAQVRALKQATLAEANALSEDQSTWFDGKNVNAYIKQFYADYDYPFTDN